MRAWAIMLFLALAAPASAEIYQWTDDAGTLNFTENFSAIPKKYRKQAVRVGDEDPPAEAVEAPAAKGAGSGKGGESKTSTAGDGAGQKDGAAAKEGAAPRKDAEYGGKRSEVWQAEFDAINREMTTVKQELAEKRNKVFGDSSGISRQDYFTMQKDIAALEKRYADLYASKQDLVKRADAAGVPDALRW